MQVKFYEKTADELLKFVVILSVHEGKYVFCKHRERDTYELPGGHREVGETVLEAAKRELYEETGARVYTIRPVCVYSAEGKNRVNESGEECFGMLYFAEIMEFEENLHSEIEKIVLLKELPDAWTYPLIQPKLIEQARKLGVIS